MSDWPEWQSIETAPKDGTRILGWGKGMVVWEIAWRGVRPPGFPADRWSDEWIGWTRVSFQDGPGCIKPTHWLPLPPPPKEVKP